MDIRQATCNDAERICALCETLGYPASISDTEERLARVLDSENGDILVAELCGVVVGFITVHIVYVVHDVMPWGRISALVVDENFRELSIGRQLLDYAETYFNARRCLRVEVTSHISREEAHGFYLHLGYRITPMRIIKLLAQRTLVAIS